MSNRRAYFLERSFLGNVPMSTEVIHLRNSLYWSDLELSDIHFLDVFNINANARGYVKNRYISQSSVAGSILWVKVCRCPTLLNNACLKFYIQF